MIFMAAQALGVRSKGRFAEDKEPQQNPGHDQSNNN
jgi:hypothetical protein